MTDLQPVVHVVDDEPLVRRFLATLLGHHTYRVVALGSAEELLEQGAVDSLTKPLQGEELIAAVEKAIDLSKRIRAEDAERRELLERLGRPSRREAEVLRRVAAGKLNKQIAAELNVVEKTVKTHRSRTMQKPGLRSVAELVRLADKAELFLPPPLSESAS